MPFAVWYPAATDLFELSQANKYEQILARRAENISQNLHRALDRHKRLVTEDVTAALVEHVRSTIMYERQHLRELEALRPDIQGADKKYVPQKPVSAPRPTYIPPLEDYSKPPVPRPASGPPTSVPRQGPPVAPPLNGTASMYGPPLVPPINASVSSNGPSQGPLSSGVSSPVRGPLPPQSPGAGPSSSPAPTQSSFAPPLMDGPPLGGRFMDGTKSMFVKSPSSPMVPSASTPTKPASAGLPPVPQSPQPQPGPLTPASPLHASVSGPPSATSGAPHPLGDPLSASAFVPSTSSPLANGRSNSVSGAPNDGLDPLGMTRPAYMSATVRTPTRPRLDAREAASKLANMF